MTHDFARVITPETPMNEETEGVCTMMVEMLEMRNKWLFKVGRCGEVWGSVGKCVVLTSVEEIAAPASYPVFSPGFAFHPPAAIESPRRPFI